MTRKHTLNEHYKEIAREIASRLDTHEFVFDGTYEDQDDDFEITDVDIHGQVLRVTGKRVDGGDITFDLTITDVEIEEGTS